MKIFNTKYIELLLIVILFISAAYSILYFFIYHQNLFSIQKLPEFAFIQPVNILLLVLCGFFFSRIAKNKKKRWKTGSIILCIAGFIHCLYFTEIKCFQFWFLFLIILYLLLLKPDFNLIRTYSAVVFLTYLVSLIIFKLAIRFGDLLLPDFIGANPFFNFSMRSNLSIIILVIISYFLFNFSYWQIIQSKWYLSIVPFIMLLIFVFMSGQNIMRKPFMIKESFIHYTIRMKSYADSLDNAYWMEENTTEYEKIKQNYACYIHCDNFFIRKYQTDKNVYFIVFKGFGPVFSLPGDKYQKKIENN